MDNVDVGGPLAHGSMGTRYPIADAILSGAGDEAMNMHAPTSAAVRKVFCEEIVGLEQVTTCMIA